MSGTDDGSGGGIARRFARAHARLTTVGVTGTNGKTSTVTMVDAIARASGECGARLTTLGAWVGEQTIDEPEPARRFLRCVETAVARGAKTLALEMTSKALAGGIATRWRPRVGVFTNLTRDHLDLHQTPEAYLASKAQLFLALPPGGVAVLNADDGSSALLTEVVPPHATTVTYGTLANCTLRAEDIEVTREGTRARLCGALEHELRLRVHGRVHVFNAMGAALAMARLGVAPQAIVAGLEQYAGVPGRFEIVASRPLCVVDYAHTPDGLERTLETARALVGSARVICVFGCGGERDQGKRAAMGAAADAAADLVVLTDDNPRREDPRAIAAAVREGASGRAEWKVEHDRRRAIELALAEAGADDVVVVAGKGHETEQIHGTTARPFSDADELRRALDAKR